MRPIIKTAPQNIPIRIASAISIRFMAQGHTKGVPKLPF